MPTYFLTHHFPENFQGSPETAAAATAWFERLGAHLVGRGNRAFETRRLGSCGADGRLLAYTIVSAENPEEAVALAEAWPLLARGGGVEVRELTMRELDLTVRPGATVGEEA
jgi:hypothetical protein